VRLNGIAPVHLTVRDFAACVPFYERLLAFFEMECLGRTDTLLYCVGSRTGIGIRAAGATQRRLSEP
jgi:hypothetical protein